MPWIDPKLVIKTAAILMDASTLSAAFMTCTNARNPYCAGYMSSFFVKLDDNLFRCDFAAVGEDC